MQQTEAFQSAESGAGPPAVPPLAMFGWDINKLVEGATALVNDAQQDIANWDRREDATDATASGDPAGSAPQCSLQLSSSSSSSSGSYVIRSLRVNDMS